MKKPIKHWVNPYYWLRSDILVYTLSACGLVFWPEIHKEDKGKVTKTKKRVTCENCLRSIKSRGRK